VQTALPTEGLERYRSNSQRARVATEGWGLENFFCPNCEARKLKDSPANTHAYDYSCGNCSTTFQLKSQGHAFGSRIVDSAYESMVKAIRADRTPNLFAMHYDRDTWRVENLILIPHFAFPLSAIEKRKPLSATARRAGWVGCNILLSAIPADARIQIISDGKPVPARTVREQYVRVRPLEQVKPEKRGWALDVLNVVSSLGKTEFDLADVYEHEGDLARLHPNNRNVRPKIRQQLQELRNLELLEFCGNGKYRMR
jgi:type II restriction enzyme